LAEPVGNPPADITAVPVRAMRVRHRGEELPEGTLWLPPCDDEDCPHCR
jgi:hypothetical protein